jgi:outer membrane receptor protein involved in Fe transport
MMALTNSIKGHLTATVFGLACLAADGALAQDLESGDDPGHEPVLEEIIVAGTRIKRTGFESAAPLTVIDRDMIESSGHATITDLLRTSAFNSFGSYKGQSGGSYGKSGAAFIDLRGLGQENTLVLLNGRRLAPFPGSGAESQDLNQIPMDAVERIEILRDGSSAIYGSDAIAGVVNIVTRTEVRSAVATLKVEDRDPRGGETGRLSLTGGYGWERGNLTFSLEHFRQDLIYERDIPRLADPTAFGEFNWWAFPAGFMFRDGPLEWSTASDPRCPNNQGESAEFPNSYLVNAWDWEAGADRSFAAFCGYNYAADTIYLPRVERNSLFLDTRIDLASGVRFVSRALFYIGEAETRYAASLVSPPPWFDADNPNNPMWLFVGQTITDPGLADMGIPGGTWTFTEADVVDVQAMMRMVPMGPRDALSEHENWSLFAGLEGELDWFGGVEWDLGAEYASSRVDDTSLNRVNKPVVQEVIDNGSLDLFNVQGLDHETWLANTTAAMQQANHTSYYFGDTDVWTIDGKLSFDGFRWDSRPVPAVVGFEYSRLEYSQGGDAETREGIIGGGSPAYPVDSEGRDVATIYAETLLPLTDRLELNLALRHDDYSDFGGTTNPKVSLAWRPGSNWVLRGSWGTGFKAPTMVELYQPRAEWLGYALDHVGCASGVTPCANLPYPVIYGGNPNLEPHESESWTAGVVWKATDQLVLELSYYDIEYTNSIGTVSLAEMFDRERDGLSHMVVRHPDGTVDYVEATRINLSGERTNGIDASASYVLSTERAGLFDFTLESTWPLSFEHEVQEGDGFDDFYDWLGYPRTRANLTVNWTKGDFQATWVTHFISDHGKHENWCWPSDTDGPCEAGSKLVVMDEFWSHDLQWAWNAPWDGQIAIGARNLFDEDPPYHDCCVTPIAPILATGNADWNLYDPTGRSLYLRYRHEF